jgi:hypothetical protein
MRKVILTIGQSSWPGARRGQPEVSHPPIRTRLLVLLEQLASAKADSPCTRGNPTTERPSYERLSHCFGCLECAVSGCHGRHFRLWTSTAMSTKVSTPANF